MSTSAQFNHLFANHHLFLFAQFSVGTLPYSLKCITEARVGFIRLQKGHDQSQGFSQVNPPITKLLSSQSTNHNASLFFCQSRYSDNNKASLNIFSQSQGFPVFQPIRRLLSSYSANHKDPLFFQPIRRLVFCCSAIQKALQLVRFKSIVLQSSKKNLKIIMFIYMQQVIFFITFSNENYHLQTNLLASPTQQFYKD